MRSRKQFCSLFLIFTLFIGSTFAQEIRYGLSLGISKTSISFSTERHHDNPNPENNYNMRVLVEFQPHPRFGFETGLKYFKSSYNMDLDLRTHTGPSPTKINTNLSYLSIPFSVNYYLPFISAVYIGAGLEGAFLTSASSTIQYNDNTYNTVDESSRHKNIILIFALSFGIEYKLGNIILFVEPEYTNSRFDVSKNPVYAPTNYSIESININFGVKF